MLRKRASFGKKNHLEPSRCWQAVKTRDRKWDGVFVYGVRSTRIYCRPSCPARRPERNRVIFFASSEAAQRSGFRPCRRCHPEQGQILDRRAEAVRQMCRYIELHQDEALGLATLAAEFHRTPSHLQRIFKQVMGVSPRQYVDACRMGRLRKLLRSGQPVTQALYDVGFGSSSRLYERSSSHLGMTPAIYRQGGTGVKINYTIVPCSLGQLLVGTTERGVCAVRLGDSSKSLETGLRAEFPQASFEDSQLKLSRWVEEIVSRVQGNAPGDEIPLDVQATAFQRRVWQALCEIPRGVTRSYREIAKEIGKPRAFRAVARACATNPVAVVVPCHRVVRSDGGLGGYRWGLKRKEQLLKLEKESIGKTPTARGA